jgi:hypothetical protein
MATDLEKIMLPEEEIRNDNTGQKSESPNTEEVEFDVEDVLKPYARNDEVINQMIVKHETYKMK